MKNKIIWICLIIAIMIGISIWTSTLDEKYEGQYYKYTKYDDEADYKQWTNEENYIIIKNNTEFENFFNELEVNSNNVEVYKLKNEINEHFFEENALIIVNHNTNIETNEYKLKSVITQDANVKINFKICSDSVYFKNIITGDIRFAIPINSKTIDKVEVNVSSTDIYDEISTVCKNLVIILIFIIVSYMTIRGLYKKTNSKLKTVIIFIILALAIVIIIRIGYDYYEYHFAYRYTVDKPIIYLYPKEETEVEVKVTYPEKLTCTYPEYEDSWKVLAEPTGELRDLKTERSLYCLYYEGLNTIETPKDEGFVVKGEDTILFLEEKLEILGLTEREANEFIIYWLPKLEVNEYNFIRFQTIEEINENMPLEITPTPDTIIRVMMEYKPLTEYMEVQEQSLTTPIREGFTVVEWGGTEIK